MLKNILLIYSSKSLPILPLQNIYKYLGSFLRKYISFIGSKIFNWPTNIIIFINC